MGAGRGCGGKRLSGSALYAFPLLRRGFVLLGLFFLLLPQASSDDQESVADWRMEASLLGPMPEGLERVNVLFDRDSDLNQRLVRDFRRELAKRGLRVDPAAPFRLVFSTEIYGEIPRRRPDWRPGDLFDTDLSDEFDLERGELNFKGRLRHGGRVELRGRFPFQDETGRVRRSAQLRAAFGEQSRLPVWRAWGEIGIDGTDRYKALRRLIPALLDLLGKEGVKEMP